MNRSAATAKLFPLPHATREPLAPGALVLRGFALGRQDALRSALNAIIAKAPFRHMQTPGGKTMSVAMSNCGEFGWLTDRRGYRYERTDPVGEKTWPPMPDFLRELATSAAAAAGFAEFFPDACLINRYKPGARMSLHQDRDEIDFGAPIVSISLGLPATFLFGGDTRAERPERIELEHGDVLVFGGASRLRFHGVLPLKAGLDPVYGAERINLTLRKAR